MKFHRLRLLRRQFGQSSTEYAVVCAVFAMVLGLAMLDDKSVLRQLLDAFVTGYQRFAYALSLPI